VEEGEESVELMEKSQRHLVRLPQPLEALAVFLGLHRVLVDLVSVGPLLLQQQQLQLRDSVLDQLLPPSQILLLEQETQPLLYKLRVDSVLERLPRRTLRLHQLRADLVLERLLQQMLHMHQLRVDLALERLFPSRRRLCLHQMLLQLVDLVLEPWTLLLLQVALVLELLLLRMQLPRRWRRRPQKIMQLHYPLLTLLISK
jgi:ABC-type multidrug transport system fused ATPase/permease subunit